jgi:hypothetical protein
MGRKVVEEFDEWERLVGQGIIAVEHTDTTLIIKTRDFSSRVQRDYTWVGLVTQDCCSRSWIDSVDTPVVPEGRKAAVVAVQMPEVFDPTRKEEADGDHYVRKIYEFRIKTTSGDLVVDFRNDSNGYYGAELKLAVVYENHYGDETRGKNV